MRHAAVLHETAVYGKLNQLPAAENQVTVGDMRMKLANAAEWSGTHPCPQRFADHIQGAALR